MLICRSGEGAEGVHIGSPHSKIQHLLGKKGGERRRKGVWVLSSPRN